MGESGEIRVLVLQSAIGDAERKVQWEKFSARVLHETGHNLCETDACSDADFVFLATGGVEQFYADNYREMPRAVYAPRCTNAYAAMNEIRGFLAARGERVFCNDDGLSDGDFIRIACARRMVRMSRIAMFGAPAPWLIASFPTKRQLHDRFGTALLYEPWETLDWPNRRVSESLEKTWHSYAADGVDGGDLDRACRLSQAMIDWAGENRVDGITVGCFPLLAHHVSACVAVSDLLDAGYCAACENDICSVMGMLVARKLGLCAIPPWMANLVDICGDRITLQHCTIAKTGLASCRLMTHFESDANVGVAGSLFVGSAVTVFRFDESFSQATIVEGEVVESGPNPLGCRTSATIQLKTAFPEPLGNHHIVVMGHVADVLRGFCRMMGIE